MKTRFTSTRLSASFLSLGLFLLVFTSACASAAAPSNMPVAVAPSETPLVDIPSPTPEVAPTEALAPTALPIATSRGPNLEATDPRTVSLASGQIQFVEFFRFT